MNSDSAAISNAPFARRSFDSVESDFPFVNMFYKQVDRNVVFRGSTEVDGEVEDVLAYLFDFESRRERAARLFETGAEFNVVRMSAHTCLLREVKPDRLAGFHHMHEFVFRHAWRKEGINMYLAAMGDVAREEFPKSGRAEKFARGFASAFWKLERLPCKYGMLAIHLQLAEQQLSNRVTPNPYTLCFCS